MSKKNGSFCDNQLNSQSTFILNCIFYFDWILESNRFAHFWRIDLFSLQQFFKCRKYSCSIPKHHNEIASDKYSVQKLEKQEEIDRFSHEIESISQSFVQCALSKSNEFFLLKSRSEFEHESLDILPFESEHNNSDRKTCDFKCIRIVWIANSFYRNFKNIKHAMHTAPKRI